MEKYQDIFVLVNGKEISLDKCANVYGVDPDLLNAEFMDTGDINESIYNSVTKERLAKDVRNYIFHTPVTELKKNYAMMDSINNKLKEQKLDVLNYIYHCEDDVLKLNITDIISLLIQDGFNKPLVDSDNKEFLDRIIKYCNMFYNNENIEIDKFSVKMILKILDEYRLSINDSYSLMNKYQSLIDMNKAYDYSCEPNDFIYEFVDNYNLENNRGRSK